MMNQIDNYFQPKVLESFDMLNPLYFNFDCNSECADLSKCYYPIPSVDARKDPIPLHEKFSNICNFFIITITKEECANYLSDWKNTLPLILKDPSMILMSHEPPGKFWGNILKSKRFLRGSVRDLVQKIMATTFSSATAERAFSLVTQIRRPERSGLTPENMENLMRVKYNGPKHLNPDRAYIYTREFLKLFSRVDDDAVKGGRRGEKDVVDDGRSEIF